MQIMLSIPDLLVNRVQERWDNLPRKALEMLVIEAYRSELITRAEVGKILELPHRLQVDVFLKDAEAYLHYDLNDFEQDLATLDQLDHRSKANAPC
ncbi:MAG: UPF0175 family protein [Merismopedia sp. SIO2A8]|nr:UPF0175 family protein [Symploca sp. SIO2B6]NET54263.1 UPF0175 family protein [Merismopedia sp. SIO2A8]